MAEPMAVQPAGEASAELTYALRVCDGATGAFSGAALTCAPCPGNGSYCMGGADGSIRPCAGGTFGNAPMLASPSCSGACEAGYFCPAGSRSRTATPAPSSSSISCSNADGDSTTPLPM